MTILNLFLSQIEFCLQKIEQVKREVFIHKIQEKHCLSKQMYIYT
jgi:hypothetical protein